MPWKSPWEAREASESDSAKGKKCSKSDLAPQCDSACMYVGLSTNADPPSKTLPFLYANTYTNLNWYVFICIHIYISYIWHMIYVYYIYILRARVFVCVCVCVCVSTCIHIYVRIPIQNKMRPGSYICEV